MKVLSIVQPWATLIALGEKKFETRSWNTKHRGDLLIHASKKIDKSIINGQPFYHTLLKHGINSFNDLPTGMIIARCNLIDVYRSIDNKGDSAELEGYFTEDMIVTGNEYEFGDYARGRFVWELSDVEQITPIPAKGQLGVWNYNFNRDKCVVEMN